VELSEYIICNRPEVPHFAAATWPCIYLLVVIETVAKLTEWSRIGD